jgi:predicted ATPase
LELPPEQMQRYLFQGVSEALARVAQKQPQLLILEDLHWADESTLALVSHLANFARPLPILIIGTYRDGLSDDNAALVLLLEELIRAGVRPMKLGGLPRDSVAKILKGLTHRKVDPIFQTAIGHF